MSLADRLNRSSRQRGPIPAPADPSALKQRLGGPEAVGQIKPDEDVDDTSTHGATPAAASEAAAPSQTAALHAETVRPSENAAVSKETDILPATAPAGSAPSGALPDGDASATAASTSPHADATPPVSTQSAHAKPETPASSHSSRTGDAPDSEDNCPIEDESYYQIKAQVHERLIEMLDLTAVDELAPDKLRVEIARLVERILRDEFRNAPLNAAERRRAVAEIQDEVLGLGPLEPLLQDPTISDILVNNYRQIYVERRGKLTRMQTRFRDDTHLKKIIDRIVSRIGRRVDEASPMVDARLEDGSRVNAIIPPLALDGPSLSIRRFSRDPLELDDLINFGALTRDMGEVLQGVVKARLNIIVSGGTGSGKTTMLNCMSRFVPHDERIVTIEDAAELQLKQDHVVRLETRPPNIEGLGEVTARDLVKNCLRMRPDRIIVGEVRGAEVLDMLQAMNTGHDGSLTTIHANTPRDALMRLETMVAMGGLNITGESLKRYIASAVDIIVQVSRMSDGTRKMISFQEVTGMEGDAITMQEIFSFKQTGIGEGGKVLGFFRPMGVRPRFAQRLDAMGVHFDGAIFDPYAGQEEP